MYSQKAMRLRWKKAAMMNDGQRRQDKGIAGWV
jgi:hypothetical protein